MAAPSSTSSSKPRLRAWLTGLLVSLGLLGLAELGSRWLRSDFPLGYYMAEGEAFAVRENLNRQDPDLVILGSSRAREALALSRLDREAANLAFAAATAEENAAIMRVLIRKAHKPALVIYAITPRQLYGSKPAYAQGPLFWNLDDYQLECAAHQSACPPRSQIVHNNLQAGSGLFGLRSSLRGVLHNWVEDKHFAENPVQGGRSIWHQRGPELSLLGGMVDEDRVQAYVRRLLVDGAYPMGDYQLDRLTEIVELARQNGIGLVLVETPVAPILRRHLPPDVYPRFHQMITELSQEKGVAWVKLDELNLRLLDADFLDQSHLNLRGAVRFTDALRQRLGGLRRGQENLWVVGGARKLKAL